MSADLEEVSGELKSSNDSARRAASDAARLAEELRQAEERATTYDRARKQAENAAKDMAARLEEAEAAGLRGGKKAIAKLESKCQELEMELDGEQRRHNETKKAISKQERRLKELAAQADEDRKNNDRNADMINKLNDKVKSYQRQVEDAVSTHFIGHFYL